MPRDRDNPPLPNLHSNLNSARPAAVFGPWSLVLWRLLGLALLALAVVTSLALHPEYPGLVALLALGCGVLAAATLWRQRQLQWQLRDARAQQALLGQLLDVWQWQTDAEHRLTRLQPPLGAPSSSWVEGAFSGELLWQRFADAGQTLAQRMAVQSPLLELRVQRSHDAGRPLGSVQEWLLRGLPRLDARGQFAGYQGTARALDRGQMPAQADADGLAKSLAEDQASFSYTISHDLRAPIRVVDGFARILKEDYGGQLDRIGNDHLDRVQAAAARMNSMIDALLSLSRLSAQPLARESVDLSRLATQVAEDLHRGCPERLVKLRIQPGLAAFGDSTLLHLVLENLIGNAWKYSAKVKLADISFEQVDQDGRAVFVVRDNGAGFDMRSADRLFGVFARLHGSSEFPGHGVGLASVRRIVRRHGGEIWADAEPGHGARFYFTLNA